MRRILGCRRGRYPRCFKMRGLQLPPEFSPEGDRRRGIPPPILTVLSYAGGIPASGDSSPAASSSVDLWGRRAQPGRPGGRVEPERERRVEEAVQDQVHAGAEGKDAGVRGEAGVEDSEARRGGRAAVLYGDECEAPCAQSVDAQQQTHSGTKQGQQRNHLNTGEQQQLQLGERGTKGKPSIEENSLPCSLEMILGRGSLSFSFPFFFLSFISCYFSFHFLSCWCLDGSIPGLLVHHYEWAIAHTSVSELFLTVIFFFLFCWV